MIETKLRDARPPSYATKSRICRRLADKIRSYLVPSEVFFFIIAARAEFKVKHEPKPYS